MKDTPLDRLRHVYERYSIWELHNIQRGYIEDYRYARLTGDHNRAEVTLATINDFGKLIEERETK